MEDCEKSNDEIEGVSQIYAGKSFPKRLWLLLSNSLEFNSVIHWSEDGQYIVIPIENYFEQRILHRRKAKIFKTESMKSFVRQLNLYGFHKVQFEKDEEFLTILRYVDRNQWPQAVFKHPYFIKGRDDLLEHVKRRCNIKQKIKNVLQSSVSFDNQNNNLQYPILTSQTGMPFMTSSNYGLNNSGKDSTKQPFHLEWRISHPYIPIQYFMYPQECLAYNAILTPSIQSGTENSLYLSPNQQEYILQSSSNAVVNSENPSLEASELTNQTHFVSYCDSFCDLTREI